ncbi:MAG TPA: M1 family peptidase [Bacteroidetes bacterium]|nr:M1 family peptidase [Bacteroidota bacterium]
MQFKYIFLVIPIVVFSQIKVYSQQISNYWQQKANYQIHIDVDVKSHSYKGIQKLKYYNNSPDTLKKVYYHLFYNAFQPGSRMDIRNRNLLDPDRKLDVKIKNLKQDEIGNEKVLTLTQNGSPLSFNIDGTILEAILNNPIIPGDSTELNMIFEIQIPLLCRRSGRDNAQGVDYSMGQWYPKLAEYDYMGWHADQYIGREFYGVWGDFDVTIDIDSDYKVVAGADLSAIKDLNNGKSRYHFISKNVHDFVWAADRDYKHYSIDTKEGVKLNFCYQDTGKRDSIWRLAGPIMAEAFSFMNDRYGKYQYSSYTFIEGGDGGMEYPLATLITGNRGLNSLVGISIHELMHSWYQFMLATNESLYPWMDEGFTSFATIEVLNYLSKKGLINRKFPEFPFQNDYDNLIKFNKSIFREPLSLHADHYNTNYAYWENAYTGGEVFLKQLEYIIGKKAFDQGLLNYFDKWKFKHPAPIDFIRVMEKTSGMELDWYLEYFIYSTKDIDYAVDTIIVDKDEITIGLTNLNTFPMPIDVQIQFENGKKKNYHIPMDLTLGSKKKDNYEYIYLPEWNWVSPGYRFSIKNNKSKLKKVIIDPSGRLFDIDRTNNVMTN